MSELFGKPCEVKNSFASGVNRIEVTCAGVVSELSRAPVFEFQKCTVASPVPPPVARREVCHGHQARA